MDPQVQELGNMWLDLMKDFKLTVTEKDFTESGRGKQGAKTYEYAVALSKNTEA